MSPPAKQKLNLHVEASYSHRIDAGRLRSAARAALRHQAAGPSELSIRVTSDEALRDLNREFLGYDEPTDVLAFPAGVIEPDTQLLYLGDIAISYPRARDQAREAGHPVWAELQLLVVHGVLHLLGHDHAGTDDRERMWAAQNEIVKKLKTPLRHA
jgi:probable rRNA maturation factor